MYSLTSQESEGGSNVRLRLPLDFLPWELLFKGLSYFKCCRKALVKRKEILWLIDRHRS
jgi:hypothetical protein